MWAVIKRSVMNLMILRLIFGNKKPGVIPVISVRVSYHRNLNLQNPTKLMRNKYMLAWNRRILVVPYVRAL